LQIIIELSKQWPGLKLVRGKPRHSQSQGSVERANQEIRELLTTWMAVNNSKNWSKGLQFVQVQKNRSYHSGIKRSPYEALFGRPIQIGLDNTLLSACGAAAIDTEEDLVNLMPCTSNYNLNSNLEGNSDQETCVVEVTHILLFVFYFLIDGLLLS
jgi:hypothetical protein